MPQNRDELMGVPNLVITLEREIDYTYLDMC